MDGLTFESQEELDFHIFLKDCALHGLVEEVVYQPAPYLLAPKASRLIWKHFKRKPSETVERVLFQSHEYTPDWSIVWTPKFLKTFPHAPLLLVLSNDRQSGVLDLTENKGSPAWGLVDVKGDYNRHGGDRVLPIHQKLLWYQFNAPLTKIVPEVFFQKLGAVPDSLKWIKGRKKPTPRKAYAALPTLDDICRT